MKRQKMTDQQLVEQALRDDAEAFELLFHRHRETLQRFFLQKTHYDVAEADDLLQDAFVKIYQNLRKFDPKYDFGQWVRTVARNIFIDQTRRKKDPMMSVDAGGWNDWKPIQPASLQPSPEEEMIRLQDNKELNDILEELTPLYREMIVMRYVKEMSYDEIAEKLGIPMGTVKTRIKRAKERFSKLISKRKNDGGNDFKIL